MKESFSIKEPYEQLAQFEKENLPNLSKEDELFLQAVLNDGYPGYKAEEKVDFLEYWRIIRKRLWLIFAITILATLLASVYVARKPDVYQSKAIVQVDLESLASPGKKQDGVVVVNNPVNDPAYFNTQLQILKGEALQRRVVKTLDLENNKNFLRSTQNNKPTFTKVIEMFGFKSKENLDQANQEEKDYVAAGSPGEDEIAPASLSKNLVEAEKLSPYIELIRKGLEIEPVTEKSSRNQETRLIEIKFTSTDPAAATKVVNTIADTFVLNNMERKIAAGSSAGDFLTKRVAELQLDIRRGEEQLLNYATNNQILSLDNAQDTVVDRLVGLNKQLLEAENERKLAEAAYRAGAGDQAAEALALSEKGSNIDQIESKLTELKQKRAQLLVDYKEKYPEVRQVDEQIKILENQLKETRSRGINTVKTNLETRYRQALSREKVIREDLNKQKGETLKQNAAAVNYRILQQEIETNKTILNNLLQQSKENDVVKAGNSNNISVTEYSVKPRSPVGPQRLSVVAVAFALSLCFGIGLSIFVDYLDDSIKTIEDVEKHLNLPTLALVPKVKGANKKRLIGNSDNGSTSLMSTSDEMFLSRDVKSPLAEVFRQLRTAVLLSTAGREPKTILVTSSLAGEGKTTTSANFAISLAINGANVLLIDGDMRRPKIHNRFGLTNKTGLSTILTSNYTEEEILSTIQEDKGTGLDVMPCGVPPPNPAELLGSKQMEKVLKFLESRYTHIVIDSPPIIHCTDGVILAGMVDGVIVVISSGSTPRGIAKRVIKTLKGIDAKVFGAVLNNISKSTSDYYYYNNYKKYYGNTENGNHDEY